MSADKDQIAAMKHGGGPALVSAGPGSGKTFVLTQRIRYLIQNLGISPKEILVLTFSKKAAAEMKERFLSLMQTEETEVTFGTFHAVFLKFLKFYAREKNYTLINEGKKRAILRSILAKEHIYMDYPEFLSEILFDIQNSKSGNLPEEEIHSKHLEDRVFRLVMKNYEEKKKEEGLIDFDDILYETARLLSERPDLLKILQNRFSYVLLDEFQDINPVQYEIVCMICDRHRNLFAVGDDDQSIYSFRGAKPEIMIRFREEYPNTAVMALSNNYRCGEEIVKAAGRLISHNEMRIPKRITALSGRKGEVIIRSFENKSEEYSAVAEILKNRPLKELSGIAVLTRTNVMDPKFYACLKKNHIPFYVTGKTGSVYDGYIGRDILAYLNMTSGTIKKDDFLRVANRPNRYIPTSMITANEINFEKLMFDYRDKPYVREYLGVLRKNLAVMGRLDPYSAIIYLRKAVGYEAYIKQNLHAFGSDETNTALDDLNTVTELSKGYNSVPDFIRACRNLADDLNEKTTEGELSGVAVMTLHASKGLEFNEVIIPDVNEGNIPIKQAVTKEEIEEERRMLYVGMTRAREKLCLFCVCESNPFRGERFSLSFSERKKYEQKTGQSIPSRFIDEILK